MLWCCYIYVIIQNVPLSLIVQMLS